VDPTTPIDAAPDRRLRPATFIALASCCFFILLAQPFITRIGIQNDEALFGAPIYLPGSAFYYYRIASIEMPLMRASYIGALKTLLWRPVFGLFGANAWSIREPCVLLGALAVWLTFLLIRRLAGERAAVIGTVLLAADSMFLLMSIYDFGPQVVGRIPLMGALLLLLVFFDSGRDSHLAGAAFLAGLALWHKALALWLFGGMGVAAIVFYPRPVWKAVTARRLVLLLVCTTLGALPLVMYNIHSHLGTLRQNALPDDTPISVKIQVLRATFDGSGLIDFLNAPDDATPAPHAPSTALERASAFLADAAGHPRHYWMIYAFLVALLLAPLGSPRDRRLVWFCLLSMAIIWAQMAWTTKSGTSIHHTILMWPLPQVIMGVSFSAASRRLKKAAIPALAAVLAVLAGGGVLVTNEYYTAMARNGGTGQWTTAITPLVDFLRTQQASAIYSMDWGFINILAVLEQGRLPLSLDQPDDESKIALMLAHTDVLFVTHTPEQAVFPERSAAFLASAARQGYRQEVVKVIGDKYGRRIFVVYRMRPR
jgi:4-amino-4-deoxy-L-arabinose transferase-like glycosyltransferase